MLTTQLSSAYDTPLVTSKVGSPASRSKTVKGVLCHQSPSFKAAFEGSFKEAKRGILELPGTQRTRFSGVQELGVHTQTVRADNSGRSATGV